MLTGLSILATIFILGFGAGYGLRAHISHKRRERAIAWRGYRAV